MTKVTNIESMKFLDIGRNRITTGILMSRHPIVKTKRRLEKTSRIWETVSIMVLFLLLYFCEVECSHLIRRKELISNPEPPPDLLNDPNARTGSIDVTITDEDILRFFYIWTGGNNWKTKTNWLKSENEVLYCKWFGITCSATVKDSNGFPRVAQIELPNNNLIGAVPLHLLFRSMPELKRLDLHGNDITYEQENTQLVQLFGSQPDYHRQVTSKIQYLDLSFTHGAQDIGQFIFDQIEEEEEEEEEEDSPAGIHMPMLTDLYLSHAHIIGKLPALLFSRGFMDNLERLVLDGNDISGSIPTNIGHLSNLRLLSMKDNKLTGILPESLSHLNNARSIILQSNKLRGPLPREWNFSIGNYILTFLQVLDLSHQEGSNSDGTKGLNGSLPSFAYSRTLKYLDLSYNSITGSIPVDFLSSVDIHTFQSAILRHNKLTGHVPSYILEKLPFDAISLEGNRITSIDRALCDPSRDTTLAMFGCDAFLCGPAYYGPEIGRNDGLGTECLTCKFNNKFWGLTECDKTDLLTENNVGAVVIKPITFPPTQLPTSSTKLTEIDILVKLFAKTDGSNWKSNDGWMDAYLLEKNGIKFEASLCDWHGVTCGDDKIYDHETVVSLQLGFNNLRGKPPKELFLLPNLESLDLSRNAIIFDFQGIQNAKKLENLNLGNCNIFDLTGLLSQNVADTLQELHLEGNTFPRMKIPDEIFSLTNLKEIFLDNNHFTGKISSRIQSLQRLMTFSAANNLLTGSLPSEMSKLSDLSILRLQNNRLSGELSPVVTSLNSLSVLNLSHQRSPTNPGIIGNLPDFRGFSMLQRLYLDVNGLTGTLPEAFLEGSVTENFEFVDLSYNFLGGNIPAQFSSLKNVYLKGNEITSINGAVCDSVKGTRYESFGCNAILCAPGTWNALGRQSSFDSPCDPCNVATSKQFYGMTSCQDINSPSIDLDNFHDSGDQTSSQTVLTNPSSRTEKEILIVLYTTCGGRQWVDSTNWLNKNVHICKWFGITCNENEKVSKIELRSNGLFGEIPPDIFHLRELEELLLDGNRISIDFHSIRMAESLSKLDLSQTDLRSLIGIEKATKLTEVILSSNDLYGTFPSEILQLTKLELLHMDSNSLRGTLPYELKSLSSLENLLLNNNKFEGSIPDIFASMSNLHLLNLQSNGFSGDIPLSLQDSKNLYILDLSNQKAQGGNGLDGDLPSFASLYELERLDLSANSLKGNIPVNFLSSIRNDVFLYLDLKGNDLSGTIPPIMVSIDVDKYDLSNNKITGISNELCNPALGGLINQFGCDAVLCPPLSFNSFGRRTNSAGCTPCISLPRGIYGSTTCEEKIEIESISETASLPTSRVERDILLAFYSNNGGSSWHRDDNWGSNKSICDWFGVGCPSNGIETVETLVLSTNNIIGLIPNEIFSLPNLEGLALDSNKIFFTFSGIEDAKKLKDLDLSDTGLHTVDGIEKAENLLDLQLASNELKNSFPQSLLQLTSLKKLTLDFNKISGFLPSQIGLLSNLQILSIVSNQLSGSIPSSIGNLSELSTLHLQHNSMKGALPSTLMQLPELRHIDLSHQISESSNGFTGSLPSFREQKEITRIDLSYNSFSGPIPTDFLKNVNYIALQSVDLRNNKLFGKIPPNMSKIFDLSLQDNMISDVEEFCQVKESSSVGEFDCSEFLCPPKTFSPTGKKDKVATCTSCPLVNFYGSTTCENDLPAQIDLVQERQILEKLWMVCHGYEWYTDTNWVNDDVSVCDWVGIDCVDGTESIKSINLGSNNVKGTIPRDIFALPNLESLALYSNSLDGIDFSEIRRANKLRELLLDATNIASFDGISNAPSLKRLNMRHNSIKSEFPSEILRMTSLTSLNLGHNLMYGSVPSNLNVLTNLKTLLLTDNSFNGDLSGVTFPSSLQTLDLSKNIIAGTIPSSFMQGRPTDVELEIDLSNNLLTGFIPSELVRFEHLNLYLQNNYIAGFQRGDSSYVCTRKDWNDGEVGLYGCNAILCPPGTFAPQGRQNSISGCQDCKSADFYGTTLCLSEGVKYDPSLSSSSVLYGQTWLQIFPLIGAGIFFPTMISNIVF